MSAGVCRIFRRPDDAARWAALMRDYLRAEIAEGTARVFLVVSGSRSKVTILRTS